MKFTSFAIAATIACASASAAVVLSGPAQAASAPGVTLTCSAKGATDFSMDARFEDRRGRKKFNASFESAPNLGFSAGQRLSVSVGGRLVGQMTLVRDAANGDVIGDLSFDSLVTERKPFPAAFPAVVRGTSVVVGALGCALN